MSQQMWKVLPYTPWKNMMVELPGKVANSIEMKEYGEGFKIVTMV